MAQREYRRIFCAPAFSGKPKRIAKRPITSDLKGGRAKKGMPLPPERGGSVKITPPLKMKNGLRRLFDVVCAAGGLAVLAPFFALIALAIKLDDDGPIFYSHFRVGKGFRNFRLVKFRSMVCASPGSTITAPLDVRVTRIGRFLRKYKLDELPQLWNVLTGEMQLVGARPQMEKFVQIFHAEYEELLQEAPGITDLASLSFRNEQQFFHQGSIEEQYVNRIMPAKLKMSLKYSRSRTFRSDLEILFRTVLVLPSPSSAWEGTVFDSAGQSISNFVSGNASRLKFHS